MKKLIAYEIFLAGGDTLIILSLLDSGFYNKNIRFFSQNIKFSSNFSPVPIERALYFHKDPCRKTETA